MERETEFRELFAASYARVVGTVYLIVQDRARAEEIAQDAFMQLLRHWRKVSRRDQRVRSAMERMRPQEVELPAATVSAEVLAAVRELSPKERAVVVLFYFEDRPIAEIAQTLDCSESAAAMRLHRARKRLAMTLSEEVNSHVG